MARLVLVLQWRFVSVLIVTGTDTGVGKTVVSAAIVALLRAEEHSVAVLKAAQTGVGSAEDGDLSFIRDRVPQVRTRELRRYPDPLSPEAAARRSGIDEVTPAEIAAEAARLDESHRHVLIEGAGGLLVRFDSHGGTVADVAWALGASVVLVASAGLGTLNATALTAEVATRRGLDLAGVIIGSWPEEPGLAEISNVTDLPVAAGAPLLGSLEHGVGTLAAAPFLDAAARGLSPWFGGTFDPDSFTSSLSGRT